MMIRPINVTQTAKMPEHANQSIHRWGPAGIAVATLAILVIWTWRAPRKRVSGELVGKWHTTASAYADRTFELDNVCITFTTGEGTISVGFIQDLKEIPAALGTLYTVSYTVDGAPNVVSFYYSRHDQTLWFKNQDKIIWKKDKSS